MEPPTASRRSSLVEEKRRSSSRSSRSTRRRGPRPVRGLPREQGVAPDSETETFVALEVEIDNWRWAGRAVLPAHRQAAWRVAAWSTIDFREPPLRMFPTRGRGPGRQPARLRVRRAGRDHRRLPGQGSRPTMRLGPAGLRFHYEESFCAENQLEAYERLIHDAMLGDATLFTDRRGDRAPLGDQRPTCSTIRRRCIPTRRSVGTRGGQELLAPCAGGCPEDPTAGRCRATNRQEERADPWSGPKELHDAGQSLWLDNITRDVLNNGTLERYIDELSVTGLTSNPTIFDEALKRGQRLRRADPDSCSKTASRGRGALLRARAHRPAAACDLFADPRAHQRSRRLGLARGLAAARRDAEKPTAAARSCTRAGATNLFIKIPGTPEGLPAIEEAIFAGVRSTSRCSSTRPVRRPGRGLHARHRAPDRAGPRPPRRLGRLDLRQPLGRRRRRPGVQPSSRTGSASRSRSDLRRLPAACSRTLAAPRERGRPAQRPCSPRPAPRTRRLR